VVPVTDMVAAAPVRVRRIGLLGVPSSAGSHNPGQEKAPTALRAAGLVEALSAAGLQVRDFGDLPVNRHRPTVAVDGVRDLTRVIEVVGDTADRVEQIRSEGFLPLVVGGDCTITLGVVLGLSRQEGPRGVGLIYFDGDADLNTPATSGSGVLDTMGMTHLLGGGAPALAGIGPSRPLLPPDRVELFGFDPAELDTGQWAHLTSRGLHATPAPAVRENPGVRAAAALARLQRAAGTVLVHFDVDVLDTGAFPLANFPHFAGLTMAEVATCLTLFCADDAFAGLVLTEVNPDHDPDGVLLTTLINTLAAALTPTPGAERPTVVP